MPNLNNTYQQINTSLSGVSNLFSFSGPNNLEIDAGTLTLDTATLNLDGSTAVYVKRNGTIWGTFNSSLIEFKNASSITLNPSLTTYIQQSTNNIASFSFSESAIDSTIVKIGRNKAYNCFFGGSDYNGPADSRAYFFGVSSSSSNQTIYNYFGTTEETYAAPTNNYFGLGYHKIDSNITSMPDIPVGNLYFASNSDTELVLIYRGLDGGYRSGTLPLT